MTLRWGTSLHLLAGGTWSMGFLPRVAPSCYDWIIKHIDRSYCLVKIGKLLGTWHGNAQEGLTWIHVIQNIRTDGKKKSNVLLSTEHSWNIEEKSQRHISRFF